MTRKETNMNIIVLLGILMHTTWGVLLLASPDTGMVTAISHTQDIFKSQNLLGVLYLFVAITAIASYKTKNRKCKILLLVPQQLMLFYSAWAALAAINASAFADGVIRSRYFITADQIIHIFISLLHLKEVYDVRR